MTTFTMEQASVDWMVIATVVGVLLPIVSFVIWKKKKNASVLPMVATAMLSYLVTSSLKNFIEMMIFQVMGYTNDAVLSRKDQMIAVAIDGALTAVLIVVSVLLILKYFLKNYRFREVAISTGIGVGLMNSFGSALRNLTMYMTVTTINKNGFENTYNLEEMEQADIEKLLESLTELVNTPTSKFVLSTVAIVLLFVMEVCVGALLFFAFFEKTTYNYLLAVAARLTFDVLTGVMTNQWACIISICLLDALMVFYVVKIYQKSEIPEIDPEKIKAQQEQRLFRTTNKNQGEKSISAVMKQSSILENSEEKSE